MTSEHMTNRIFVFGSNLAGRHGKGSALEAVKKYGAVRGQGIGRHGNSYAIPTKDSFLRVINLTAIQIFVNQFIEYATAHPELDFYTVAIGCGEAGYTPEQIAPFFARAPKNVLLPPEFRRIIDRS